MAVKKVVLLAIIVVSFPYAENAPSTNNRSTKDDELRTKLVFSDYNDGNTFRSNSRVMGANVPSVRTQRNGFPQPEEQLQSVFATINSPPVVENAYTINLPALKNMDERQNWGLLVEDTILEEDESYYDRPLTIPKDLSFNKIEKSKSNTVTKKPTESPKLENKPSACDTAVIACCAELPNIMQCFKAKGCTNVTKDMFTYLCSAPYLNETISRVAALYKM